MYADQRKVVDLDTNLLAVGEVMAEAAGDSLPLRQPTSLKNPEGTEISVQKKSFDDNAGEVTAIVMEKIAKSEEVNIAFQWRDGAPARTNFQADMKLFLETISKGGNLSIILKAKDGERVIPRLQITNGGAASLVQSLDQVYRLGELPMEKFFVLSIRVNYDERKVRIFVNNEPLGDEVPLESEGVVTNMSISCSDVGTSRRVVIGGLTALEAY